jgi:hypothetical protein
VERQGRKRELLISSGVAGKRKGATDLLRENREDRATDIFEE